MYRHQNSALILAAALAGCASVPGGGSPADALQIHRDLLVLDAHLDTTVNFGRERWDFSAAHALDDDIAQVDLGRMAAGNLDGGFFVVFTDQGPLTAQGYRAALANARARSEAIDNELAKFPDLIGIAASADEAEALSARGKLIGFKSMENSYPLGENLALLEEFYADGLRMAGPVHVAANQFADSSSGEPRWNGLSPLGREWVAEMNRLGIVIDGSHASDAAFDQMVDLSAAPIILSHTSPRWAYDHPRNLDDARIRKLAANDGAICMSTIFMSELDLSGERGELFDQYGRISELSPAEQRTLSRKWRELDRTQPLWDVDFERYMEALLHLIDVAGVNHVCFGNDWDGGGGIDGLMDITALPKVTQGLLDAGYSPRDIEKMTSGNILRIVRAAETVRDQTSQ